MVSKEAIKLRWLVRIRWGAALAWGIIALIAWQGALVQADPVPVILYISFTALSNLFLTWLPTEKGAFTKFGGALLAGDIVALTALLFCYGGYTNPFSMMFLVYVTIAAFVLNAAWTWWSFAVSSVGFISLFFFHIPLSGFEVHHHGGGAGFNLHLHGMLIAFIVIGALTSLFLTRMSRELELQEESIQQLKQQRVVEEKFLAIATLAAGAAHELSTPIGTLSLISDDFAKELSKEPRLAEDVALMQEQLTRCNTILDRMRGEAGRDYQETLKTLTTDEIRSVIEGQFASHNVEVACEEGSFSTYPRTFFEATQSLIKNACQASRVGQTIVCALSFKDEEVEVLVRDHGSGMSESEVARAGEPFYTTKAPGAGFGLGLFLVKVFAQRVGGAVHIRSAPGEGTEVILKMPRVPLSAQGAL